MALWERLEVMLGADGMVGVEEVVGVVGMVEGFRGWWQRGWW